MLRGIIGALFASGASLAAVVEFPVVRYQAETGMYVAELDKTAGSNGQERVLRVSYPFETITNAYLELAGEARVSVSVDGERWPVTGMRVRTPGAWLEGTTGLKAFFIRLEAQGSPSFQRIAADCGRSKRVLEARSLPPRLPSEDAADAVICHAGTGVTVRPRASYYTVCGTRLTAAQMGTGASVVPEERRFESSFYVVNENAHAVTGRLEVVLPPWAQTKDVRIGFRYAGDTLFGIPQPPDAIQFDDGPLLVPDESGWLPSMPYAGMRTNAIMTLTWNRVRRHRRETRVLSMHNPVSFKGQARYEYMLQNGQWAWLGRSPWMTCPIPAAASRTPFKLRATCVGDAERGRFSTQGLLSIPRDGLLADDYFLPIDNGDGRGNPLAGWKAEGFARQGDHPIAILAFKLEANPNPLLLHERSYSTLTSPGPQVLVKVEVER